MSNNEKVVKGFHDSYHIPIHYSEIEDQIKWLAGRILTIIDSAISEERQNKALKDLIKGEIRNRLFEFQKVASENQAGHNIQFEDELKS